MVKKLYLAPHRKCELFSLAVKSNRIEVIFDFLTQDARTRFQSVRSDFEARGLLLAKDPFSETYRIELNRLQVNRTNEIEVSLISRLVDIGLTDADRQVRHLSTWAIASDDGFVFNFYQGELTLFVDCSRFIFSPNSQVLGEHFNKCWGNPIGDRVRYVERLLTEDELNYMVSVTTKELERVRIGSDEQ